MALLFACLLFLAVAAATFHPSLRLLYARNPAFMGMVLTLCACFLGVYGAIEFSRLEERQDRMARAATLMDMAKETLTADRAQARLAQFRSAEAADAEVAPEAKPESAKPAPPSSRELGELLNNGAVLEQISPASLKVLLACQAEMQRELRGLAASQGRARRHHLNGYLRELAFAQGVLAAEAEFQRGNIGRGDLEEILREWSLKKGAAPG
jgi:hypothetical protein